MAEAETTVSKWSYGAACPECSTSMDEYPTPCSGCGWPHEGEPPADED